MRLNNSNATAILLVLIGIAFLLDNMGMFGMIRVADYFPLLFSFYGVMWVVQCKRRDHMVWPGVLIVGGVLGTLANLRLIHLSFHELWPLILIGVGISMLVGRSASRDAFRSARRDAFHRWRSERWKSDVNFACGTSSSSTSSTLDEVAVFGEVKRTITSQEFAGGQIKATFGAVNLDLRHAAIPAGKEVVIDCNATFGGIELKVPETWRVVWTGSAVFGGFKDKTLPPRPEPGVTPPTLVLTGTAAFGGIEVRN